MRFETSGQLPASVDVDWLIVPVGEDLDPASGVDHQFPRLIAHLRENQDFAGKPAELLPLYGPPGIVAPRVLLLGVGRADELSRSMLTKAGFAAGKFISGKKRERIGLVLARPAGAASPADVVLGLVGGFAQGCHGPGLRQSEPARHEPDSLLIFPSSRGASEDLRATLGRAQIECRAVNLARDLVNEPPCDLYPESFALRAAELCQAARVECTVLDQRDIERERMGCLLGVAQGSARPPRVVVLRYRGGGAGPTLGLVGKGVTFDSGGLSLKSNEQMQDMKSDMAGAAAVLASVLAIADLGLPVNLLGVMALVENMPSGHAMKLGDVLRARNGKTVEVLNTDAEGRLILADALCYATDQRVSHLVDVATLTGACMVALGLDTAGLMTNNQPWADRVLGAVRRAGERAWQMPLDREYGELLRSQVADMKNIGGRYGGAILAAKFLEAFVGTTPWVHLDIAGPSWVNDDSPTRDHGGTGCMVRSLIELAIAYGQE